MNARTRRRGRRRTGGYREPSAAIARWDKATRLRDEWLGYGLSSEPADRSAAEAAITELYRLVGRRPPDFVWVDSPAQGLTRLPPDDRPVSLSGYRTDTRAPWFVTYQLADRAHRLRGALDARSGWPLDQPERWHQRGIAATSPEDGGVDLRDLLEIGVHQALRQSIVDGARAAVRRAVADPRLCWYGQHEAHWIGYYDILRRLGVARYTTEQNHHLDQWCVLARSGGWWWSYDGYCVVSERPSVVHHETVPGAVHGERRIHHPSGPAIRYRDGTGGYAWRGTPVPAWVVLDPTAERIGAERNIEVRRCAIERLGWDVYIDRAGLTLVATAPDPGNPGRVLRLYDLGENRGRVLLATNGSVERDGHRRRYGLTVPATFTDPVAAAGWTYGLSGERYAQLQRRT